MKNFILVILSLLLTVSTFTACTSDEATGTALEDFNPKEKESSSHSATSSITHFNFIISPDLSNRLQKQKPVSDTKIVETVLQDILPRVLTHQRTTNQKDRYTVSFVSNKAIPLYEVDVKSLKVDFNQFKKQQQRIEYIKDRSTDATLSSDKQKFVNEFDRISQVASKSPDGADLWTYFDQGIDNNVVNNKSENFEFGGKSFTHKFRNIMVLLTDGYIEAGLYGKQGCATGNQCYYLSSQRIKAFREAFKKSGEADIEAFFEKNNYGIVPANNSNLKDLEVLVLQMEDRSLDKAGNATQHPTDMEIMKLFWADWLAKSGVKRFELRPVLASEADTEKVVLSFIGV